MKKFLSITEFADAISCTRQNVHLMIQSGKIKATQVGNGWIIGIGQLDKFKGCDDKGGDSGEEQ
jgi:excisionase family DNA binding protein